jgi:hypothetical protein
VVVRVAYTTCSASTLLIVEIYLMVKAIRIGPNVVAELPSARPALASAVAAE